MSEIELGNAGKDALEEALNLIYASKWRLATKTVILTGAADAGAVGTVPVFTVSGDVEVNYIATKCTTNLVDAGGGSPATLELGVTGYTTLFWAAGAVDPADAFDAGMWMPSHATGPAPGGETFAARSYFLSSSIFMTVAGEAVNSGVLVFYVMWRPLSAGATLVAAE